LSSFAPRKSLGQHFLTDRHLLQRIADALEPSPGDVVLEIGPGHGDLTRIVAAAVRRVVAIERDRRLAHDCGLRIAECGLNNVEIVEGDALRIDWHRATESAIRNPQSAISDIRNPQSAISDIRNPHSAMKIIGNIPYNITSPLIEKALTPPLPERVVFLVQAEVAERLAAAPGTKAYGALTVGVQAVCTVERLFTVRAGAFRPPPRVDSAVVRLVPRAAPVVPVQDHAEFRRFVTACFSGRRKQLRNAVAQATGARPAVVGAGIASLGLDPTARPETLPPADFARLLLWSREL
jgi:16S rRNA (adenine1518-N6/adenine1519-N6)-dimethyltransferase